LLAAGSPDDSRAQDGSSPPEAPAVPAQESDVAPHWDAPSQPDAEARRLAAELRLPSYEPADAPQSPAAAPLPAGAWRCRPQR
jgi:hypothetical protein